MGPPVVVLFLRHGRGFVLVQLSVVLLKQIQVLQLLDSILTPKEPLIEVQGQQRPCDVKLILFRLLTEERPVKVVF